MAKPGCGSAEWRDSNFPAPTAAIPGAVIVLFADGHAELSDTHPTSIA
jgi:prepilin-type processing-associated H-X9-DG protein